MAGNAGKGQVAGLVEMTPRDILFECPSCGKSLVVDEAAQGLIVDCPQCSINVIVPPKPAAAPRVAALPTALAADVAALQQRLNALSDQLKGLQTQRTEINNRLAARINEFNRDLVMMARLETSHQQILGEWKQLVSEIGALALTAAGTSAGGQPVVVGSSASSSGRTRVQFGR